MKIHVTGATGFVGSALCAELHRRGHEITGSARGSGSASRLDVLAIDWARASGTEPRLPVADLLIHAAFQAPAGPTDTAALASNEAMAAAVARAATRAGIARILLVGSGSVYAESTEPLDEDAPTVASQGTDYPASSLRIERLLAQATGSGNLSIARLFYPYGPGQAAARLIPRLAARIRAGEPIPVRARQAGGFGAPAINPVFLDDAARVLATLAERFTPGPVNVAGPETVDIHELALRIGKIVGGNPLFDELSASPAPDLRASTELLRARTGFLPETELNAGLQLTFAPRR